MVRQRPQGALMSAHKRVVKRSTPTPSRPAWIVVRILLVARGGESLSPPPGRDMLASSSHTFADLAAAIDRGFARWDLAHLHEFRFSDGRVIGMADTDEFGDGENEIDERTMTIGAAELAVGESFDYLFDFGDGWEHRCTVLRGDVIQSRSRAESLTRSFLSLAGVRYRISTDAPGPTRRTRRRARTTTRADMERGSARSQCRRTASRDPQMCPRSPRP
jgi:hypothetical protein